MGNIGCVSSTTCFSQHYVLGKTIGCGTFATVKRCVRKLDNKEFAVKIVEKAELTPTEEELIGDEVDILSFISHSNIISIEEAFECDKRVKIVLELCDNKNLMNRINEAPNRCLEESECAQIIYCIASTLNYLHSKLIIHRDLKPENICFDKNGIIKLIDFGSAFAGYKNAEKYKNNIKNIRMKQEIGTPFYVAPEVIVDEYYGYQCDLWSLGVILYQMLSGYHPFSTRKSIHYLYKQIINGEYKFDGEKWKNVSKDAIDLITKLMCIDKKKRITTTQIFKHPFIIKHVNGQHHEEIAKKREISFIPSTKGGPHDHVNNNKGKYDKLIEDEYDQIEVNNNGHIEYDKFIKIYNDYIHFNLVLNGMIGIDFKDIGNFFMKYKPK